MNASEIARTELMPIENWREYRYPDGTNVRVCGVKALAVSSSGNHRLETADGHKHIIAPGWRHIEIDVEAWTL